MNQRDRGFIVGILQIGVETAQIAHQKHALVDDRAARKGNNIGVLVALLKETARHIQLAVKINAALHALGTVDEALLDIRHTLQRLVSQNGRI